MKKALIVIDAQKIYSLEESGYYIENISNIVEKINHVIKAFEKKNDTIIYVKHEHKIDGSDSGRMFDFYGEKGEIEFKENSKEIEFISDLYIAPNSICLNKTRYDAFIGTDLESVLKEKNIEKVVICGFMTNFCCESTARHAHDVDFFVDFVADAMGTPGTEELLPEEISKATIATLESGFAIITNAKEY